MAEDGKERQNKGQMAEDSKERQNKEGFVGKITELWEFLEDFPWGRIATAIKAVTLLINFIAKHFIHLM
jgi:hypothetical protein